MYSLLNLCCLFMNDHKIQPLLRHGQDQDEFDESADEYGDYDDDEDDEVDR